MRFFVFGILLLLESNLQAQSFIPIPSATLKAEIALDQANEVFIYFENQTNDSLHLRWRKMDISIPEGWDVDLCDFGSCYIGIPGSAYMNIAGPDDLPYIKLIVQPGNLAGTGCCWFRVYLANNESEFVDVFFNLHTPGLSSINSNNPIGKVFPFPNPASSSITVTNDVPFASIFKMHNLSGTRYGEVLIPGASQLVIDVSEWPAGYYFLQSYDTIHTILINH